MQTYSLNGLWQLYRLAQVAPIPATVPGCVHTALLAAGQIPDPFYRDNELKTMWIGETDWIYRRRFDVDAALLAEDRVLLRCEGLDTLARVTLNGHEIGRTDNMFRTWEFDVKAILRAGENEIEVYFDAPMPYVTAKLAERNLPAWGVNDHKLPGGNYLRKEQCNFGWDWGPMCVTSGIWRDIEIIAFSNARLADVHLLQDHADGAVTITARVAIESTVAAERAVRVTAALDGKTVAQTEKRFTTGTADLELAIPDPQLWWPNGMGAQPLYTVTVDLLDYDGESLDRDEKRIGLRTLRVVREADQWGESFCFAVNDVRFFAKGANWIPADTFLDRLTRADYARLLEDAAAANMNMLRVWGGGIYEPDVFYDLADELGLCLWQDFMFGCATYPTFDDDYMANVAQEFEDNIRRLRHHASIALWCGNNELEQGLVGDEWTERTMSWEDYSRLYDQLLPQIVNRLDPETDYWPSSPHTPVGDRRNFNDPRSGDAHIWSVWHGRQPFEFYRTCEHRFNSEFGFQSFPEPRTVYSYTEPADRNVTTYVMEHHQRSGIGNSTIIHYLLDWFRLPTSFDRTLWLSQILQGMAIKYAVEHWRRSMPQGMGTLYWQINDCWPVASWSSIDSFGRWKALHYMARHFFAPILVSGVEDPATGKVDIHVTSDRLEDQSGQVRWFVTDTSGEVLESGLLTTEVPALQNHLAGTVDVSGFLAQDGARRLLIWLELEVEGEPLSTNLVHFARPKHLELLDPTISTQIKPLENGRFGVTLQTDRPALWVWLQLGDNDATYSDNFVHLRPGAAREIVVTPAAAMNEAAFAAALTVHSLADTYAS
jgi:beta-mannosidase